MAGAELQVWLTMYLEEVEVLVSWREMMEAIRHPFRSLPPQVGLTQAVRTKYS